MAIAAKSAHDLSREEIANDLRTLALILNQEALCLDTSPLQSAAAECQSHSGNLWGYRLVNLRIALGSVEGAFPTKRHSIVCGLNCSLKSSFKVPSYCDPYKTLSVDFMFEGTSPGLSKPFRQAWHLDRHITSTGSNPPKNLHPLYHFNFGGKHMTQFANDKRVKCSCHTFGDLLLLEQPRFLHPPLDAILAVDLILSNCSGDKWKRLRTSSQYIDLIRRWQKKSWESFSVVLASHWNAGKIPDWTPTDMTPVDIYPALA